MLRWGLRTAVLVRATLLAVIASAFQLTVGIPLRALDLAIYRSFETAGDVPFRPPMQTPSAKPRSSRASISGFTIWIV